ncbi:glycosyltransferase family 4 protein [Candidatus Bathyarchaeota archaeon]|nr:glycosyltransferase family 4 protein [Candidatus Bathyarchaeota archaeon]
MSVTLIHPSVNRVGGAEKMCLEMIGLLKEAGYRVGLYTLDRPRWERVEAYWGHGWRPDEERHTQEAELSPSTSIQWLRCSAQYLWLLHRAQTGEALTLNTYGEVYPYVSDVSYIQSQPLIGAEGNPYEVPLWEFGKSVYGRVCDVLAERCPSPVLVANSLYNAGNVSRCMGVEARVLHPFIDSVPYGSEPKTGQVLTVCRLTPRKNLQLVPEILGHLRGVRACVAGATTHRSQSVMEALSGRHIDMYLNPRRGEVTSLMKRASVYLSTQRNEAFGISVLEAMSAGCVPVVYRCGGPWRDILMEREGEAGFGYDTAEEAAGRVGWVLRDEGLRERLRANAVRRAGCFTRERFRDGLLETMEGAEHREVGDGVLAGCVRLLDDAKARLSRLS